MRDSVRAMQEMERSIIEVTLTIRDAFTPAIRQAKRAFQDFVFTIWLLDQPRYLWPLMRFAYWVERKVFRL